MSGRAGSVKRRRRPSLRARVPEVELPLALLIVMLPIVIPRNTLWDQLGGADIAHAPALTREGPSASARCLPSGWGLTTSSALEPTRLALPPEPQGGHDT